MHRLIDADAYIEEYQVAADMARKIGGTEMNMLADFYCEVIKEITKRPTVDAVEVVRCKDCTFWTYEGVGSSTLKRFGRCAKWYPFGDEQHNCHDDDFCSYGERKDNG